MQWQPDGCAPEDLCDECIQFLYSPPTPELVSILENVLSKLPDRYRQHEVAQDVYDRDMRVRKEVALLLACARRRVFPTTRGQFLTLFPNHPDVLEGQDEEFYIQLARSKLNRV